MNAICIIREPIKGYLDANEKFRPSKDYPEYLFDGEISRQENVVYDMIRNGFKMLKLDEAHFGTPEWNPLGELIYPGNTVLLKPNLVFHTNQSGCGTDCVYTHPSLTAAIIDYIVIALKGTGKIIVGDAPIQECEFDKLIKQSGYDVLCEFYRKKGINIELIDFRNVKTYEKNGLHYFQEKEQENGCIVRLDEKSAFSDIGDEKLRNLRITNYDPRILQQHHHGITHEYNVSKYVLDADVVINMPKPKTHRKAGVTISLKNMVGINANKEFLPHHTLGSKEEGGDAYLHANDLLKMANEILDIRNQLVQDKEMELAKAAEELHRALYEQGRKQSGEEYWEGSWYGNDTIWRTVLDLNRIIIYADKHGKMTNKRQRRMFIVGDMIVSGEKEGPLCPTPVYPGVVVMGEDPVEFDRAVCSLMGFDYRKLPTLYNEELTNGQYPVSDIKGLDVISNYEKWNKKDLDEIRESASLEFQPSFGWTPTLGNRYRDRLYTVLRNTEKEVYVFGAGANGIYAAEELKKQGIKIAAFCDNNQDLWGKEIITGVECIAPEQADIQTGFILAMQDKNVLAATKQIEVIGGTVLGVINK